MVNDAFQIFGLQRSLYVDLERINTVFNDLSKKYHPDVSGGDKDRFEALNVAKRTLLSTSLRLKHLRELEYEEIELPRGGAMNPGLMDLFAKMGPVIQRVDEVLKQYDEAKSALSKALVADAVWEVRDQLEELAVDLSGKISELEGDLRKADTERLDDRLTAAARIDQFYQRSAFLEKWQNQVREKLGGLMQAV